MIRGSIAALVTPMDSTGALDLVGLDRLVDFHLGEGTHALVAVGTTGESATLDTKEHLAVIERVVDRVAGRIPVIAGTGSNSTREAVELTSAAKSAGADACLLVTPYYVKPTQEGMIQHFLQVAESVEIPQILYNVPTRTGCDLKPESVATLSNHANIVGLKDATGDLLRGERLISLVNQNFGIYSGDDLTALKLLKLGAAGNISVTANLVPKVMARLCEAALCGNLQLATALDATLTDLHRVLFCESNPVPCKWALHEMGLIQNGIRLPLIQLSDHLRLSVMSALQLANQHAQLLPERLNSMMQV